MDRRQLKTRSFTAAVLGVLVIGLLLAGLHATMALVILVGYMSAVEFYRITVEKPIHPHTFVFATLTSIPLLLYVSLILATPDTTWIMTYGWGVLLIIPLLLTVYFALNITQTLPVAGKRTRNYALALLSVTVPCLFALMLALALPLFLLGIFILIWISDIVAYLAGSQFGRNKLAPTISPGKTWEGTIGAVLVTLPCGALLAPYFFEADWQSGVVVGVLIVIFGTLGDLWQSMFKRLHQVKDSGTLLPGHGGFWDRFDSFLGSVPWVGLYYMFFLM
jgi:phosphatidate cytidylyltransferase